MHMVRRATLKTELKAKRKKWGEHCNRIPSDERDTNATCKSFVDFWLIFELGLFFGSDNTGLSIILSLKDWTLTSKKGWTFSQRSFQFLQSQVHCSSTCRSAGSLDLIWYSRSFSHTFNQISWIEYIHSRNFIHRDIKPTHPLALDFMQGVHVQVAGNFLVLLIKEIHDSRLCTLGNLGWDWENGSRFSVRCVSSRIILFLVDLSYNCQHAIIARFNMVDYEPHPRHLSPSDCHPICNGDQ